MAKRDEKLIGKIFLEGQVCNLTQMSIGSGASDNCDQDIIKLNNLPYIPATALAGVLKDAFLRSQIMHMEPYFWGNSDHNDPYKSHIMFDNSLLIDPHGYEINILDGIEIVPETNQVKKGSKYDYEVLEPGASFNFRAELSIHKNFDFPSMLSYADHCLKWLNSGELQLGSMTTAGLGRVKGKGLKMFVYDFVNDNSAVDAYFEYLDLGVHNISEYSAAVKNEIPLPTENIFVAKGTFNIKSKLITAQEAINEDADSIQLNRKNGEYYINGRSQKGGFKHRITKIYKTLGGKPEDLKDLFGHEGKQKEQAQKARIYTEESIIKGAKVALQQRTKIDRFSGGTIDQALFNSMPVEETAEDCLTITVKIKEPKSRDILLTLQVFKDLMTGDLALGGEKNIGRGVLSGTILEAAFGDKSLKVDMVNNTNEISEYFKTLTYENPAYSK
ncbi:RAMP superfamily protein [Spirosomataceae bacterium TFI 002]|nr:RAMP superfamily protein [Spirosomataceae bacterium TFI 002]